MTWPLTVRRLVCFTAFVLALAAVSFSFAYSYTEGDEPNVRAQADPNTSPSSPATVLEALQRAHQADGATFVLQGELDCLIAEGGGGACPSAAAVDLLQALRLLAGQEKVANPHKVVLAAFTQHKDLLRGRLTNDQFVMLLGHYERYLGGRKIAVGLESAPNSVHKTDKRIWQEEAGPNLSDAPRTIRVLAYTMTEPDGKVIGRHFVLLKRHTPNQIDVVDPSSPLKDRRYILEHRKGDREAHSRIFLLNPAGIPRDRGRVFELDTVFSVSLPGPGREGKTPPDSVKGIQDNVDATATQLRGTKDFLNPRVWRKLGARYGLPGLDLPPEYGGSGWPAVKMIEVFKHAGSHNLNFRDVVGGAHVRPLLKSIEPRVLDVVRQVARGDGYVAIAITEPEAGSDVPAIASTSRRVEGGYLLTGQKRFNARLDQATHVILFTQGTTGVKGQLSVFVVPINTPGLEVETLQAHGLTGNSYGGLKFKGLFVPEGCRIGEDGKGMDVFTEHFLYWRLMQTAAAIGTGENALQQMADRIKRREAFGGPIGRFTHLQQPIGQHTTELRMAHALAKEAASLIDRGDYKTARELINGLKAEGVEISLKAVDAAMRAFGGLGYSTEVDLGDRLRDLNGLRIADGTTDVMRMDVVRWHYGREFWEMAIQPKQR